MLVRALSCALLTAAAVGVATLPSAASAAASTAQAVTRAHVTSVSDTTVSLAWTPTTPDHGAVVRRTSAAGTVTFAPLRAGVHALTDRWVTPGTAYRYSIAARTGVGSNVGPSRLVNVTTTNRLAPGPVSSLAGRGGDHSVTLTWTNPTDRDLVGPRICRVAYGATPPAPASCPQLARGARSYSATGVAVGRYGYWVYAVDTAGHLSRGAGVGVHVIGPGNPGPVAPLGQGDVTADALPTAQIDGVGWCQLVVGNTVYVGGSFAHARPAGVPAGTDEVARANLLAYDITTGELISSFAVGTDGPVLALAASPDGKRLYVGGTFTHVGGGVHRYLAAIDLTTGRVVPSFAPALNDTVHAVAVTSTTVYAGGEFTAVGSVQRLRLAAFTASGTLVAGWAPRADHAVRALLVAPGGAKIVVGGSFGYLNSTFVKGIGAVSPTTGTVMTWYTNEVAYAYGQQPHTNSAAGIYSLSTDGTNVYGTAFSYYGAQSSLEGAFAASPVDGTVRWMDDCHGDTYGSWSNGSTVYVVGHPHWCGNDNGWGDSPHVIKHAMAFTVAATGTLTNASSANRLTNEGTPAPSIVDWFPSFTVGTVTGQNQAAWSITGNGSYVVLAGEFPTVNGVAQQGLVRFATRPTAPAHVAPHAGSAGFTPVLTQTSPTQVTVTIPACWDQDSLDLTYSLVRDSNDAAPVATQQVASTFWSTPQVTFTDTVDPGSTHSYRVVVSDADGNAHPSATLSITLSS